MYRGSKTKTMVKLKAETQAGEGARADVADQITILGVIYGRQEGLNVDIKTSMELVHTEKDGAITINQDHLKKSLELSEFYTYVFRRTNSLKLLPQQLQCFPSMNF